VWWGQLAAIRESRVMAVRGSLLVAVVRLLTTPEASAVRCCQLHSLTRGNELPLRVRLDQVLRKMVHSPGSVIGGKHNTPVLS